MKRICSIDTETTGLYSDFHEVIQIAVVPLNEDFSIDENIEPFYTGVKPEKWNNIDQKAMNINKISLEELSTYPDRLQTVESFKKWSSHIGEIQPIAHNWSFDKGFVVKWLEPYNISKFLSRYVRDTCRAAMFISDLGYDIGHSKSLESLCAWFNIEHNEKHNALSDAVATAKLYKTLLEFAKQRTKK